MAWDLGEFCGESVVIGDKAIDEFSLSLTKISVEYLDRYGRKPTVAEVMYVFRIVMTSNTNDYFSDPLSLDKLVISMRTE
jgi:hypothetical protein